MAYAPSIGAMKWDCDAPPWVAEGLKQFCFIGPRDESTQRFAQRQTGQEHPLVADPTWLVDSGEASGRNYPLRTKTDFLLVYSFPLKGEHVKEIKTFARQHGLKTVGVGYGQGWCDVNWGGVDPFEWVQLFRQAKYVVTGTFHGTLFCLKQHARFCVLSHVAIDTKVVTPLTLTGLRDRHTSNAQAIGDILLRPIDYDAVESKRSEYADRSLALLQQALAA